jgi:hypothetical protein
MAAQLHRCFETCYLRVVRRSNRVSTAAIAAVITVIAWQAPRGGTAPIRSRQICSSTTATRLERSIDAIFGRVASNFASDYPYAPVNRIKADVRGHVLTLTDAGVMGRSPAGGNRDTFRFWISGTRGQSAEVVISDRYDEKTNASTAILRGTVSIGGAQCAVRFRYPPPRTE